MLLHLLDKIAQRKIILASGSPRRKQILDSIGLAVEVVVSTFDENLDKRKFDSPANYVIETARRKGQEVQTRADGTRTRR